MNLYVTARALALAFGVLAALALVRGHELISFVALIIAGLALLPLLTRKEESLPRG